MKRRFYRLILAHKLRKFNRWQQRRIQQNRKEYREVWRRVGQIRLP